MDDARLSQLATQWTLVLGACQGPGADARARQAEVLARYSGAVYRYALRALADPELAAEACQEFALRFVRGDFRHADPARGRFRDYVKTAVVHLIGEARRRQGRGRLVPLSGDGPEAPAWDPPDLGDAAFLALWRKELFNRAWDELGRARGDAGAPYYAALRLKADQPDLTAEGLADRLADGGHGRYTPSAARQVLHRARTAFADLLLEEVARAALTDDPDALADELAALDLLTYCREALARRRR